MESKEKKKKKGHEEPSGKTGIKTQTYYRMDLGIWGGGRVRCDRVREWHGHIYTTCICGSQSLKTTYWDFPGGPVVKTPSFHCRGLGFDPWSGN